MELLEAHAVDTYGTFVRENEQVSRYVYYYQLT